MKRLTAALLAIFLFVSNSVLANARELNVWQERRSNLQPLLALTKQSSPVGAPRLPKTPLHNSSNPLHSLPFSLGTVKSSLTPTHPNGTHIALLLDVHMNQEAQKNTANILRWLSERQTLDFVGLEGSVGPIGINVFRAFPNTIAIQHVADYLLRIGKISGPVYAALTVKTPLPPLMGLEDSKSYQSNINAYLRSRSLQPILASHLEKEAFELRRQREALFNSTLKQVCSLVDDHDAGTLRTQSFVAALLTHGGKPTAMLEKYIQALGQEQHLDFSKVEAERNALIRTVSAQTAQASANQLAQLAIQYQAGHIAHIEFYRELRKLTTDPAIDWSRYPALNTYIAYLECVSALDSGELILDIEALAQQTLNLATVNAHERTLLQRHNELRLKKKLLSFSLTDGEWRRVQNNPALIADAQWKPFLDFYQLAHIRDRHMALHLLQYIHEHPTKNAVVVVGGFHARALEKTLTDAGVTVSEVTPRLERVDVNGGSTYLNVFAQEKSRLEQLVEAQKLFMAPDGARGLSLARLLGAIYPRARSSDNNESDTTWAQRLLPKIQKAFISVRGLRVEAELVPASDDPNAEPIHIQMDLNEDGSVRDSNGTSDEIFERFLEPSIESVKRTLIAWGPPALGTMLLMVASHQHFAQWHAFYLAMSFVAGLYVMVLNWRFDHIRLGRDAGMAFLWAHLSAFAVVVLVGMAFPHPATLGMQVLQIIRDLAVYAVSHSAYHIYHNATHADEEKMMERPLNNTLLEKIQSLKARGIGLENLSDINYALILTLFGGTAEGLKTNAVPRGTVTGPDFSKRIEQFRNRFFDVSSNQLQIDSIMNLLANAKHNNEMHADWLELFSKASLHEELTQLQDYLRQINPSLRPIKNQHVLTVALEDGAIEVEAVVPALSPLERAPVLRNMVNKFLRDSDQNIVVGLSERAALLISVLWGGREDSTSGRGFQPLSESVLKKVGRTYFSARPAEREKITTRLNERLGNRKNLRAYLFDDEAQREATIVEIEQFVTNRLAATLSEREHVLMGISSPVLRGMVSKLIRESNVDDIELLSGRAIFIISTLSGPAPDSKRGLRVVDNDAMASVAEAYFPEGEAINDLEEKLRERLGTNAPRLAIVFGNSSEANVYQQALAELNQYFTRRWQRTLPQVLAAADIDTQYELALRSLVDTDNVNPASHLLNILNQVLEWAHREQRSMNLPNAYVPESERVSTDAKNVVVPFDLISEYRSAIVKDGDDKSVALRALAGKIQLVRQSLPIWIAYKNDLETQIAAHGTGGSWFPSRTYVMLIAWWAELMLSMWVGDHWTGVLAAAVTTLVFYVPHFIVRGLLFHDFRAVRDRGVLTLTALTFAVAYLKATYGIDNFFVQMALIAVTVVHLMINARAAGFSTRSVVRAMDRALQIPGRIAGLLWSQLMPLIRSRVSSPRIQLAFGGLEAPLFLAIPLLANAALGSFPIIHEGVRALLFILLSVAIYVRAHPHRVYELKNRRLSISSPTKKHVLAHAVLAMVVASSLFFQLNAGVPFFVAALLPLAIHALNDWIAYAPAMVPISEFTSELIPADGQSLGGYLRGEEQLGPLPSITNDDLSRIVDEMRALGMIEKFIPRNLRVMNQLFAQLAVAKTGKKLNGLNELELIILKRLAQPIYAPLPDGWIFLTATGINAILESTDDRSLSNPLAISIQGLQGDRKGTFSTSVLGNTIKFQKFEKDGLVAWATEDTPDNITRFFTWATNRFPSFADGLKIRDRGIVENEVAAVPAAGYSTERIVATPEKLRYFLSGSEQLGDSVMQKISSYDLANLIGELQRTGLVSDKLPRNLSAIRVLLDSYIKVKIYEERFKRTPLPIFSQLSAAINQRLEHPEYPRIPDGWIALSAPKLEALYVLTQSQGAVVFADRVASKINNRGTYPAKTSRRVHIDASAMDWKMFDDGGVYVWAIENTPENIALLYKWILKEFPNDKSKIKRRNPSELSHVVITPIRSIDRSSEVLLTGPEFHRWLRNKLGFDKLKFVDQNFVEIIIALLERNNSLEKRVSAQSDQLSFSVIPSDLEKILDLLKALPEIGNQQETLQRLIVVIEKFISSAAAPSLVSSEESANAQPDFSVSDWYPFEDADLESGAFIFNPDTLRKYLPSGANAELIYRDVINIIAHFPEQTSWTINYTVEQQVVGYKVNLGIQHRSLESNSILPLYRSSESGNLLCSAGRILELIRRVDQTFTNYKTEMVPLFSEKSPVFTDRESKRSAVEEYIRKRIGRLAPYGMYTLKSLENSEQVSLTALPYKGQLRLYCELEDLPTFAKIAGLAVAPAIVVPLYIHPSVVNARIPVTENHVRPLFRNPAIGDLVVKVLMSNVNDRFDARFEGSEVLVLYLEFQYGQRETLWLTPNGRASSPNIRFQYENSTGALYALGLDISKLEQFIYSGPLRDSVLAGYVPLRRNAIISPDNSMHGAATIILFDAHEMTKVPLIEVAETDSKTRWYVDKKMADSHGLQSDDLDVTTKEEAWEDLSKTVEEGILDWNPLEKDEVGKYGVSFTIDILRKYLPKGADAEGIFEIVGVRQIISRRKTKGRINYSVKNNSIEADPSLYAPREKNRWLAISRPDSDDGSIYVTLFSFLNLIKHYLWEGDLSSLEQISTASDPKLQSIKTYVLRHAHPKQLFFDFNENIGGAKITCRFWIQRIPGLEPVVYFDRAAYAIVSDQLEVPVATNLAPPSSDSTTKPAEKKKAPTAQDRANEFFETNGMLKLFEALGGHSLSYGVMAAMLAQKEGAGKLIQQLKTHMRALNLGEHIEGANDRKPFERPKKVVEAYIENPDLIKKMAEHEQLLLVDVIVNLSFPQLINMETATALIASIEALIHEWKDGDPTLPTFYKLLMDTLQQTADEIHHFKAPHILSALAPHQKLAGSFFGHVGGQGKNPRNYAGPRIHAGLIADDPRMGKTRSTLASLNPDKKNLVTAPKKLIATWLEEIEMSLDKDAMDVYVINNREDWNRVCELTRKLPLRASDPTRKKGALILCGMEFYRTLVDKKDPDNSPMLRNMDNWDKSPEQADRLHTMVVDEAHSVQNYREAGTKQGSLTSLAVHKIKATRKIMLSATPTNNKLEQLRSMLLLMYTDPETGKVPEDYAFLLSKDAFAKYCSGDAGIAKARALLHPGMLRRTREDFGDEYSRIQLLTPIVQSSESQEASVPNGRYVSTLLQSNVIYRIVENLRVLMPDIIQHQLDTRGRSEYTTKSVGGLLKRILLSIAAIDPNLIGLGTGNPNEDTNFWTSMDEFVLSRVGRAPPSLAVQQKQVDRRKGIIAVRNTDVLNAIQQHYANHPTFKENNLRIATIYGDGGAMAKDEHGQEILVRFEHNRMILDPHGEPVDNRTYMRHLFQDFDDVPLIIINTSAGVGIKLDQAWWVYVAQLPETYSDFKQLIDRAVGFNPKDLPEGQKVIDVAVAINEMHPAYVADLISKKGKKEKPTPWLTREHWEEAGSPQQILFASIWELGRRLFYEIYNMGMSDDADGGNRQVAQRIAKLLPGVFGTKTDKVSGVPATYNLRTWVGPIYAIINGNEELVDETEEADVPSKEKYRAQLKNIADRYAKSKVNMSQLGSAIATRLAEAALNNTSDGLFDLRDLNFIEALLNYPNKYQRNLLASELPALYEQLWREKFEGFADLLSRIEDSDLRFAGRLRTFAEQQPALFVAFVAATQLWNINLSKPDDSHVLYVWLAHLPVEDADNEQVWKFIETLSSLSNAGKTADPNLVAFLSRMDNAYIRSEDAALTADDMHKRLELLSDLATLKHASAVRYKRLLAETTSFEAVHAELKNMIAVEFMNQFDLDEEGDYAGLKTLSEQWDGLDTPVLMLARLNEGLAQKNRNVKDGHIVLFKKFMQQVVRGRHEQWRNQQLRDRTDTTPVIPEFSDKPAFWEAYTAPETVEFGDVNVKTDRKDSSFRQAALLLNQMLTTLPEDGNGSDSNIPDAIRDSFPIEMARHIAKDQESSNSLNQIEQELGQARTDLKILMLSESADKKVKAKKTKAEPAQEDVSEKITQLNVEIEKLEIRRAILILATELSVGKLSKNASEWNLSKAKEALTALNEAFSNNVEHDSESGLLRIVQTVLNSLSLRADTQTYRDLTVEFTSDPKLIMQRGRLGRMILNCVNLAGGPARIATMLNNLVARNNMLAIVRAKDENGQQRVVSVAITKLETVKEDKTVAGVELKAGDPLVHIEKPNSEVGYSFAPEIARAFTETKLSAMSGALGRSVAVTSDFVVRADPDSERISALTLVAVAPNQFVKTIFKVQDRGIPVTHAARVLEIRGGVSLRFVTAWWAALNLRGVSSTSYVRSHSVHIEEWWGGYSSVPFVLALVAHLGIGSVGGLVVFWAATFVARVVFIFAEHEPTRRTSPIVISLTGLALAMVLQFYLPSFGGFVASSVSFWVMHGITNILDDVRELKQIERRAQNLAIHLYQLNGRRAQLHEQDLIDLFPALNKGVDAVLDPLSHFEQSRDQRNAAHFRRTFQLTLTKLQQAPRVEPKATVFGDWTSPNTTLRIIEISSAKQWHDLQRSGLLKKRAQSNLHTVLVVRVAGLRINPIAISAAAGVQVLDRSLDQNVQLSSVITEVLSDPALRTFSEEAKHGSLDVSLLMTSDQWLYDGNIQLGMESVALSEIHLRRYVADFVNRLLLEIEPGATALQSLQQLDVIERSIAAAA